MTIRVNPCPKCGALADYSELIWHTGDSAPRQYYLMCPSCEAMTADCPTPAEALELWNRGEVYEK